MFGILSVATITILCYVVGMLVKATKLDDRFIPVICAIIGIILGLLAFLTKIPDFPASDWLTACAIGASSGLASTGTNQVYKQIKGKVEEEL